MNVFNTLNKVWSLQDVLAKSMLVIMIRGLLSHLNYPYMSSSPYKSDRGCTFEPLLGGGDATEEGKLRLCIISFHSGTYIQAESEGLQNNL